MDATSFSPPRAIDDILRDTWLMIVRLQQGAHVEQGQGRELYQLAVSHVERAKEQLTKAGLSHHSIDQILFAQCALLDESVMRHDQDDSYHEWIKSPLQARYFNTLNAGEELYERLRKALQSPAPDVAVLTCFHRVLLLGFQGRYYKQDQNEREALILALEKHITPFTLAPVTSTLLSQPGRLSRWKPISLWAWCLIALVGLAVIWWGLDSSLQSQLQTHLNGLPR